MINMVKTDSFIFEIEPGDMTKYKFIITRNVNKKNEVLISSIYPTKFLGYSYSLDSVKEFFERNHIDKEYNEWVCDIYEPFIGYIMDHSNCDRYAAVAALMCAKELL